MYKRQATDWLADYRDYWETSYRQLDTLLVQTERNPDWADGDALVITVLAESAGRTAMTVTTRYSSIEIRDAVVRGPMERGASEGYDRLETLLNEESHHS